MVEFVGECDTVSRDVKEIATGPPPPAKGNNNNQIFTKTLKCITINRRLNLNKFTVYFIM